jgi:hypothetical protein
MVHCDSNRANPCSIASFQRFLLVVGFQASRSRQTPEGRVATLQIGKARTERCVRRNVPGRRSDNGVGVYNILLCRAGRFHHESTVNPP